MDRVLLGRTRYDRPRHHDDEHGDRGDLPISAHVPFYGKYPKKLGGGQPMNAEKLACYI